MSTGSLVRDPETTLWPVTRAAYEGLVVSGDLAGQPVELLEGALVEMSPQGTRHTRAVALLARAVDRALVARHGERYLILQHSPLGVGASSVPEPDIAVIDADDGPWTSGRPEGAHLVIEVAESSQRRDLVHKQPLYAAALIPTYWVVDLPASRVVVHSGPEAGGYATVERRRWSDVIDVLGVGIRLSEVLTL